MARIINFGSICIDSVLEVPHLVAPGETLRANSLQRLPGGKGLNQSLAAARAGAEVIHVGRIGRDGLDLRALLECAGVNVDGVEVLDDVPTGHAFIQVDASGENSIVILPGANRGMPASILDTVEGALRPDDWLLLQNETDWVPEAILRAVSRGARVALNIAPAEAAAQEWPLEAVDLFILNETEAAMITGESTPDAQFRVLGERAPKAAVALTLGAEGALLLPGPRAPGERAAIRVPAFSVDVVDATGAGDAFTGALVAGLACGLASEAAVARANAAGALTCTRLGAGVAIPDAEAIEALLAVS